MLFLLVFFFTNVGWSLLFILLHQSFFSFSHTPPLLFWWLPFYPGITLLLKKCFSFLLETLLSGFVCAVSIVNLAIADVHCLCVTKPFARFLALSTRTCTTSSKWNYYAFLQIFILLFTGQGNSRSVNHSAFLLTKNSFALIGVTLFLLIFLPRVTAWPSWCRSVKS